MSILFDSIFFFNNSEEDEPSKDETSSLKDKSNRFHPYSKDKTTNDDKKVYNRNRVFINNIPFDTKWQFIKDLIRKKGNLMGAVSQENNHAFQMLKTSWTVGFSFFQ